MEWVWTDEKNRTNRRDHGLSFETARRVFDDPLAVSRLDPHPDSDRWPTLGHVGPVTLFVVHTWPESEAGQPAIGRIISACKATSHERKAYEEGCF